MTTRRSDELQTELESLRTAISGLIQDYSGSLCADGLAEAREILEPLGVKFPTVTHRAMLRHLTITGLTDDHIEGDTTRSSVDSQFRLALRNALGGNTLAFAFDGVDLSVNFEDVGIFDLEIEENY